MIKIFCVDFDGTCVLHKADLTDLEDVPYAVETLKMIVESGHKIILNTMRGTGIHLDNAVKWFNEKEIELFSIGKNPTQHRWTDSNKPYGHYYIDDRNLGSPLVNLGDGQKPYVDWLELQKILIDLNIIKIKNRDS
jgi:hydroxymethylpyrimidine pyrophosphatase-like HAD family hydrolase